MMFELLVEVTWRATLLLALVWCVTAGMRRASAAARHLVWAGGVLGVLALPFMVALPGIEVPGVGKIASAWSHSAEPERDPVAAADGAVGPVGGGAAESEVAPLGMPLPKSTARSAPASDAPSKADSLSTTAVAASWGWREGAVALWLLGCALLGLRLLRSVTAARRLVARSTPVEHAAVSAAAARVGLRRAVALRVSETPVGPMSWGLLRPSIVLPGEYATWSDARLDAVLTHELAHVRRWDCLVQLAVLGVRALLWFHPLVWMAARQVHAEQEQACDDAVVRSGGVASDYAEDLVKLAASLQSGGRAALVGAAIADRSELLRRVRYLLDPTTARPRVGRRVVVGTVGAVTMVAASLGVMRRAESVAAPTDGGPATVGLHDAPAEQDPERAQDPSRESPRATLARAERLVGLFDLEGHRELAIAQLVEIGPPAVESLQTAIENQSGAVRVAALKTLLRIEPTSDRVLRTVVDVFSASTEPELDDACRQFLFSHAEEGRVVDAVIGRIRRDGASVPRFAARILAKSDAHRDRAVVELHGLLRSGDPGRMRVALSGLSANVAMFEECRPVLEQIVKSAALDANVRERAQALLDSGGGGVHLLIADYSDNSILEIDRDGDVSLRLDEMYGVWDVEPLANGNLLVVEFALGRVMEIDRERKEIWSFRNLKNPYDADRLPNGNTLIADTYGGRVIEVSPAGEIVWKVGGYKPLDVERLANGNTLIADGAGDRIVEVDQVGVVVWQLANYEGVWDVDRLANGNTLVTQRRRGHRVIEVEPSGKVVWSVEGLTSPSDADRLANGNTIVACDGEVIEFDADGKRMWSRAVSWAVEVNVR